MLQFSDGVNIDTSGPLHIMRLNDGIFVVGNGMLLPCDDEEDARRALADLVGHEDEDAEIHEVEL